MSIAQSVIATVLTEMNRQNLRSIKKIFLRIGPWSGVLAEAVQFNFDILRNDTPLHNAQLVIEETAPQAHCPACDQDFAIQAMSLICPNCGCEPVRIQGGDELEIARLETGD